MSKNLFAPQRKVLLSELSAKNDLYLLISCSGEIIILSCNQSSISTKYKAHWPGHTFGEPLSATWINDLPLVASQKGLLLCIDLNDNNKVTCLDGFRGQGVIAIGCLLNKLVILEQSGLLRFFDVCKDPLMSWKVANEAQHRLTFKLSGALSQYQLFIKMICLARWCVIVTSTDSVIILDYEALKRRWSLGVDSAMLPVTLLCLDGRCETRGSSNVIHKVTSTDAIIDAVASLESDTDQLSFLAFMLSDRDVIVCNMKYSSAGGNGPPASQMMNPTSAIRRPMMNSVQRGSAMTRPEVASNKNIAEVIVSRFDANADGKWPSEFGVLSNKGLWIQRSDHQLLLFNDVNLGLLHKIIEPVGLVDALHASHDEDQAPGEFLVLGFDGMIMGYNTADHCNTGLASHSAVAKTIYAS